MAFLDNNSSRSDSTPLNSQTSPDSVPQADELSVTKRTDQSGSLGKGLNALFKESRSETSNLSGFPIPVPSDEEEANVNSFNADKGNADSNKANSRQKSTNRLKLFGIATAWTIAVACITATGTLWITTSDLSDNNVTATSITTNSLPAKPQKAFVQCLGDDVSSVIQGQNEQIEQTAQEISKQATEAKNKHPKTWKKYHFYY